MRKLSFSKSIDYLLEQMLLSFKRFPGVLITAFFATYVAFELAEADTNINEDRLFTALLLGFPLFLTLTFFREARGLVQAKYRALELLCGALFIVGYYWLTKDVPPHAYWFKYLQLSLILHLLVSFIAYLGSGSVLGFWQFNKNLFLRLFQSGLYAVVFLIGLLVATAVTQKLFGLYFGNSIYGKIWAFSALVVLTWHFVAGLPKDLKALNLDLNYPRALRFFVQYLLIPLVSLYMIILYCYMAKILISQNWPSGYVGWLVSIISVLGILNLLLLDPEKNRPDGAWIKKYATAYYVLVIPLLIMLFSAVGKRIAEYGITEPRYFLLVLGGLLFGLSLYFIFSRSKNIKAIPTSLCVLAFITMWGPWGASSVSKSSQLQRARGIFSRNNLSVTSENRSTQVSKQDQIQLSSVLTYLLRHHGEKTLLEFFPQELISKNKFKSPYFYEGFNATQTAGKLMESLGLKYLDRYGEVQDPAFHFRLNFENRPLTLRPYRYFLRMSVTEKLTPLDVGERVISVKLERDESKILLVEGTNPPIEVSLLPLIEKLSKINDDKAPAEEMVVKFDHPTLSGMILVESISGRVDVVKTKVSYLDAAFFFK